MSPLTVLKADNGPICIEPVTSTQLPSCVIGIDVGGTNTDRCVDTHFLLTRKLSNPICSVILQDENVLAWHKTPTTSDIQKGVELAIEAVIKKAAIPSTQVASVKIGTTVRLLFCLIVLHL
jgi:N-methylhydantoinase A/oxoprolinase/acetone carboxylase beta subunit